MDCIWIRGPPLEEDATGTKNWKISDPIAPITVSIPLLSFLSFLSFPIYALPFLHRGLSSHITTEQDTFNAQLHGLVGSDINRSYQTLSSYSAI
jgi:hypothetical protein